jgi:hypothetical protein
VAPVFYFYKSVHIPYIVCQALWLKLCNYHDGQRNRDLKLHTLLLSIIKQNLTHPIRHYRIKHEQSKISQYLYYDTCQMESKPKIYILSD